MASMGKFYKELWPCTPRFADAWRLISVMNSGLKAPLSLKSFEKMTSEEHQDYKKRLDKEQVLIKKGYNRVKEKIRNDSILNITPEFRGCMWRPAFLDHG